MKVQCAECKKVYPSNFDFNMNDECAKKIKFAPCASCGHKSSVYKGKCMNCKVAIHAV